MCSVEKYQTILKNGHRLFIVIEGVYSRFYVLHIDTEHNQNGFLRSTNPYTSAMQPYERCHRQGAQLAHVHLVSVERTSTVQ